MTSAFYLLDIPCAGSDRLDLLLRHADEVHLPLHRLSTSEFNERKTHLPHVRLGIFLCHPAMRLARAYLALKASGKTDQSFADFYRHPSRVNLYSRLLKEVSFPSLGYVGIEDLGYQSIVTANDWLGLPLWPKQNYLNHYNSAISALLDDMVLRDIERFYQDDISFYQRAVQALQGRYSAVVGAPIMASEGKRIIVHVGPPKTGTSAIQHWLQENFSALRQQGIMYPAHGIDDNGVSSGNFLSVMKMSTARNTYVPCYRLTKQLVDDFVSSNAETLLLSSEHFYYHLPALMSWLRDATFVFYIRHPLASLESGYQQEVKRHMRVSTFFLPERMRFGALWYIADIAQEFSVKVAYRLYDSQLFEGGNLISDFVSLLGCGSHLPITNRRVNEGYCYESLELKRFFNQFIDIDTASELDKWLQSKASQAFAFTLVTEADTARVQEHLKDDAAALVERYPQLDKDALSTLINNFPQRTYKRQDNSVPNISPLWSELKSTCPALAYRLYRALRDADKKTTIGQAIAQQVSWHKKDSIRYFTFICSSIRAKFWRSFINE